MSKNGKAAGVLVAWNNAVFCFHSREEENTVKEFGFWELFFAGPRFPKRAVSKSMAEVIGQGHGFGAGAGATAVGAGRSGSGFSLSIQAV